MPVGTPVTATMRSIDVGLAADAESCVRTVAQLEALSDACSATGLRVAGRARLGEDQLGGLSGIVYRHSSTLLAQACDRVAERSTRLADGLRAYADGLTEVRRLLDVAVAVAGPHLTVAGDRIWSPARPPGPDDPRLSQAWAAWHEAVGVWRRARELQQDVEQAWLRVLEVPVTVDAAGPVGETGGTPHPHGPGAVLP
jgi:hypothetical protein